MRAPRKGASVAAVVLVVALPILAATPRGASSQLTDPCGAGCGVLLGASAFTFANGASAAVGRSVGGFETGVAAGVVWAASFVAVAAAGAALSGDGDRQLRAVQGSALGAVAGAFVGLAAESLTEEATPTTRLAATLIGAAAGVLAGGAVGALTHEASGVPSDAVALEPAFRSPTFSLRIPF